MSESLVNPLDSGQLLDHVMSTAPISLFVTDADGILTMSRGRLVEMMGLRPGEHVGHSMYDLYRSRPMLTEALRAALSGESAAVLVPGRVASETWLSPIAVNIPSDHPAA